MSAEVISFQKGPPIGSFVKASIDGERLWFEVKSVNVLKKEIRGRLDNQTETTRYSMNDVVPISFDEVLDYLPAPTPPAQIQPSL